MTAALSFDPVERSLIAASVNLSALRRSDPSITAILQSASHVVLYQYLDNFDTTDTAAQTSPWRAIDVEGALFVVERRPQNDAAPKYRLLVVNRKSLSNYTDDLLEGNDKIELNDRMIMYHNSSAKTVGIWFYEKHEADPVYQVLRKLLAGQKVQPPSQQAQPVSQNPDHAPQQLSQTTAHVDTKPDGSLERFFPNLKLADPGLTAEAVPAHSTETELFANEALRSTHQPTTTFKPTAEIDAAIVSAGENATSELVLNELINAANVAVATSQAHPAEPVAQPPAPVQPPQQFQPEPQPQQLQQQQTTKQTRQTRQKKDGKKQGRPQGKQQVKYHGKQSPKDAPRQSASHPPSQKMPRVLQAQKRPQVRQPQTKPYPTATPQPSQQPQQQPKKTVPQSKPVRQVKSAEPAVVTWSAQPSGTMSPKVQPLNMPQRPQAPPAAPVSDAENGVQTPPQVFGASDSVSPSTAPDLPASSSITPNSVPRTPSPPSKATTAQPPPPQPSKADDTARHLQQQQRPTMQMHSMMQGQNANRSLQESVFQDIPPYHFPDPVVSGAMPMLPTSGLPAGLHVPPLPAGLTGALPVQTAAGMTGAMPMPPPVGMTGGLQVPPPPGMTGGLPMPPPPPPGSAMPAAGHFPPPGIHPQVAMMMNPHYQIYMHQQQQYLAKVQQVQRQMESQQRQNQHHKQLAQMHHVRQMQPPRSETGTSNDPPAAASARTNGKSGEPEPAKELMRMLNVGQGQTATETRGRRKRNKDAENREGARGVGVGVAMAERSEQIGNEGGNEKLDKGAFRAVVQRMLTDRKLFDCVYEHYVGNKEYQG